MVFYAQSSYEGGGGEEQFVYYVDSHGGNLRVIRCSADGGVRKSVYAMLTVLTVGVGRVCML